MPPAPPLPAIECGQRTDPGRDPSKQVNEDAFEVRETRFGHLCVVCDGMGGHADGREASQRAITTILEVFHHAPESWAPGRVLRTAIEEANRRVHVLRTSEVRLGHPGSTVVAALLHTHGTEIAHVGDSRAYLVHLSQISPLTRDHSIIQELIDRGLLTARQALHHPDANRITRALGIAPDVQVDLRAQPVRHEAGDVFVLCSDGLSDLVEQEEILAIARDVPPAEAVVKLVDLANARGGHDNVTVLVVRSRESATLPTPGVGPTIVETEAIAQPAAAFEGRASPSTPPRTSPTPVATVPDSPPSVSPPSAPRSARGSVRSDQDVTRQSDGVSAPRGPAHPRQPLALVIAALVLAMVAILLLGGLLLSHLAERGGKRHARPIDRASSSVAASA
ncbi:MAG TPA: protein phosphatase 2C domain-containing protein [Polyangiaceae bacterium]|nr:protein phosphatase 2C domain-containing protein [Polyangiaceae bacterium]